MDKEEIIDVYIKYLRSLSTLDYRSLKYIICKAIEKDPEQLDIFERLLFKKEKIKLSTLTYAQSMEFQEEFDRLGLKLIFMLKMVVYLQMSLKS